MKRVLLAFGLLLLLGACTAPPTAQPTSDQKATAQQERILQEANSQLGMPAITNFRVKRILKDIYELQDQEGLITYTYVWPDNLARPVFLCTSIGYGIPYSTQYTAPEKIEPHLYSNSTYAYTTGYILPQADPDGLFKPSSAAGTWVLCKEPASDDVKPQYVEPNIITLTYRLPEP